MGVQLNRENLHVLGGESAVLPRVGAILPGQGMPKQRTAPENEGNVYFYVSDRVQQMIDSIGFWASTQNIDMTRKKRGTDEVVYNASVAVRTALDVWAKEITPSTRYTLDEMAPLLHEYLDALFIRDTKRTQAALRKEDWIALRTINQALKDSNIPLRNSADQVVNTVLIVTIALARMAQSVDKRFPPLIKCP